jgi:hypothetical protein
MPRNRASLFATDLHSYSECIAYLPVPFCLMLARFHPIWYECWLTSSKVSLKLLCVRPEACVGKWALPFQSDSCRPLEPVDEKPVYIRSFHSSVLILEHSPNAERLHIPPCRCWTQKRHWQAWAAFMGALGGKRGLTRCELKRPSFGCLTHWLNGMAVVRSLRTSFLTDPVFIFCLADFLPMCSLPQYTFQIWLLIAWKKVGIWAG